jgi:hypothetical protein
MLYIALCNAISDQKAQNGRRESMKIMSDKYANYKYNLKIRQKNAQKTERVFEAWLIILRKTSVLRND